MGTEIDGVNGIIKNTTSDGDITIKGNDGGSEISALVFDMSAEGAATFNNKIVATELDISGNIDVDGTTNLDVVDIDGALTQDGGAVFNEASADVDFRVESDGNTHAFFLEGSTGNIGIGTSSIDVSTQSGGSGFQVLQIENNDGGQINLDHTDAGTGSTLGQINFQRAGEVVAEIEGVTDGATDNGRINFRTQPDGGDLAVRWTIDHNGILFPGATSQGIALGVTAATSSNILDDYEEGTWTPQLVSTGSYSGQAYTTQQGFYTKVGRAVTVTCLVTYSNKGTLGGDFMKIIGLPFTPTASITYQVAATQAVSHTISPSGASPSAAVYANNAFAYLFNQSDDALSQYETGQPDNSTQWRFCVTYQV
mgnify:CR=1 FL=1